MTKLRPRFVAVAALLFFLPMAVRLILSHYPGWEPRFGGRAHAAGIDRTAFTLHLTEVVRKGPHRDGPGRVTWQLIIAQRADGARSETTIHHPGRALENRVRLIRMPDYTHVRTWDSVGMKSTTTPPPAHHVSRAEMSRPAPASDCSTTIGGRNAHPAAYRKISEGVVRGIKAVQFVRSDPSTEIWYAPQLDCEIVYRMALFADSAGSVTDTSEKFLTSYTLGEPDPVLFDVSSLKEASPVDAHEAQYRKAGYPESFIQKTIAEMRANARE